MLWCRSMFCKTIYISEFYIMYHVLQKVWVNKSIHISTNCPLANHSTNGKKCGRTPDRYILTCFCISLPFTCPHHVYRLNTKYLSRNGLLTFLQKTVKAVCHLLFISSIMAVVIVTMCVYTVKKSYIHLQPLNRFVSTSKCSLSCLC